MKSYKEYKEALKGNQHKIDKNKNGKVDSHDFKLLRKEEAEICETANAGLAAKAEKSGISISVLRKVYNRGMAAWKTGHRPGTTPQQWAMARVNSYIGKGSGTYHGADKDLREEDFEESNLPSVAKDKETGLPKKYVAGVSDSTAKARAAHFNKNKEKSDSDPTAYKPAPGDATAKTKPSKHTLKYRAMFGEDMDEEMYEACWDTHKQIGMKKKGDRMVPDCVPKNEEVEVQEGKHVVGVTVSDPNHAMVSQRNEKKYRKAKVTAENKETAINNALAYYKKRGLKVHEHNYIGLQTEDIKKNDVPFDGPYTTTFKKKNNPNRTGMDAARALAQRAMKKKMKEEFDIDITDEQADSLIEMSCAPVAPVPDKKYIKGTPENKAAKAARKPINGMPTDKMKEEVEMDEGMQQALRKYVPGYAKAQLNKKMDAQKYAPGDSAKKTVDKDVNYDRYKKIADKLNKEEVELDERNKENAIRRKMMDASRGARFKNQQGTTVPDPEPQHKTPQAHNKAIGRAIRKMSEDIEEIEEATVNTKKYSWGTMKTIHQGSSFNIPLHPEHHQAIAKLKDQQEHKFKTEDGKHYTAKRDGDKVHFQGANNGNKTSVPHSTMKEESNNSQKEENQLKKFKQFKEEIYDQLSSNEQSVEEQVDDLDEMEFDKSGKYVHKGNYGTSYQGDDDEDDDKPKKPAPPAVKRGRGRPAGSMSGAKQKGSAPAKKRSGVEYTGFKLHLPNNNR